MKQFEMSIIGDSLYFKEPNSKTYSFWLNVPRMSDTIILSDSFSLRVPSFVVFPGNKYAKEYLSFLVKVLRKVY